MKKILLCLTVWSVLVIIGCPPDNPKTEETLAKDNPKTEGTIAKKDLPWIYQQKASYTLSASELYRHFKENEVAATMKYKGKVVVVEGVVKEIGMDIMDNPYVVLDGSGFLNGVQCTFSKKQQEQTEFVAILKRGLPIGVKGVVAGKMGNVLINKAAGVSVNGKYIMEELKETE